MRNRPSATTTRVIKQVFAYDANLAQNHLGETPHWYTYSELNALVAAAYGAGVMTAKARARKRP